MRYMNREKHAAELPTAQGPPKSATRTEFRVGCAILSITIAVFVLVAVIRRLEYLDVQGQVVDRQTGRPVSNAKVVLIKGGIPFLPHAPQGYGVITDRNGRFRLRPGIRRGIGRVAIAASSPNDEFDEQVVISDSVVLRTAPLDAKYLGRKYMKYEHFDPLGGLTEMLFLDEGWIIPPATEFR